MPDYNGEAATVLPSLAPSIGDQMRYQQQRADQQQYRADQVRSQKAAQKLQLMNHVEASTNPAKFLIGEGTIDQHTTAQLESVKADMYKYIKQNPDADPSDIAYQVQQNVAPIAIAHAKQKAILDDIDKNVALEAKRLPSVDPERLKYIARSNTMLKKLPDGTVTYKDADEMRDGDNPVRDIIENQPESVVTGDGGLRTRIHAFPAQSIEHKVGDMYAGVRTKNGFKASLTGLRDLEYDADGNVKGLKYKTETEQLPGGKTLEAVPQDTFDTILGDDNAKASFYALWNQNKKRYGVSGLPNNDPTSIAMQKAYMLDWLKASNADPSKYSDDSETYKDRETSNIEAGRGSDMDRFINKEGIRQTDALSREEIRNKHTVERQTTGFEHRKELKLIPGAKATKHKQSATSYGL